MFDVNVKGAFFVVKNAAAALSDGASVILTASISGVTGKEGQGVYAATKAAVRSLGRTFAAELAPRGIRVNTISPGPIETPIFDKVGLTPQQLQGFLDGMRSSIPLGRLGKPQDIAGAAVFLASDDSSFVTGIELFVDGGLVSL